jgi:hypothetical protein
MRSVLATAGVAAVLLAAAPAQACEMTRTPSGLRVICNLYELYKRYDLGIELIPAGPALRLNLPNLAPTDLDFTLVGSGANVGVDVENIGVRGATTFEVVAVGSVHDPLRGGASVGMTPLPPRTVSGLAAGAGVAVGMGTIFLPNRNQDWDVCTIATVDPPLAGGASWGRVLESDETDNLRTACCRAYGPNPDVNGPPAC